MRAMEEGRVVYGPCVEGVDDPLWQCTKCGLSIYLA